MSDFAPGKSSLLKRMKRTDATAEHEPQTALGAWISKDDRLLCLRSFP